MENSNWLRYWLLLGAASVLLTCCQQNDIRHIVIHLVPANYEGPLIETVQKEALPLNRSGDTIFIHYDERGIAVYRDTLMHLSDSNKLTEKYFYTDTSNKAIGNELTVKESEYYHGVCRNDHPFFSVIVRHKDFKTSFKEKQKELVEKYICNQ